jgi:hypothetical protein
MVPGGSRESLPKRKVRFADKLEVIPLRLSTFDARIGITAHSRGVYIAL